MTHFSQSIQHVYPYLGKMAVDHLAVQGSAPPVEHVWSNAANTDTKKQNRLSSDCLAALQLLKMVYRQWAERLMLIDEDWVDDFANAKLLQFPDLDFDLIS
ncbi:hypothetical protein M422DRAFT_267451 [Sphaerobolus stellatus SS14]|uniref:HAT C-terminal dimerisation domain-containing protein n=1 Tax=Sphaerobolus stellatus (strain SS14) TaxID=990650 RepID=A0A0C9TM12_SPHS4|nr:hypothetical protein M422DRAFT_267451 [Sphaerobolus stellatus SS14]